MLFFFVRSCEPFKTNSMIRKSIHFSNENFNKNENLFPQMSHEKGFSHVWVRKWVFKWSDRVNARIHIWQEYGRMPVWILGWRLSSSNILKRIIHPGAVQSWGRSQIGILLGRFPYFRSIGHKFLFGGLLFILISLWRLFSLSLGEFIVEGSEIYKLGDDILSVGWNISRSIDGDISDIDGYDKKGIFFWKWLDFSK